MKVSQHRVGSLKSKTWPNEKIRLPGLAEKHALDRANTVGSRTDYALRCLYPGRILLCNMEPLGMKLLVTNRLKCPEPDMQRHIRDFSAGAPACLQNLGRKVQPSRGRRDGPGFAGEHRLVPLAILFSIRPLDIRRQRNVANLFEHREDIAVQPEVHGSLAVLAASNDLRL